jgi:hypothetical protein
MWERILAELPLGARRDLLRVLTSPSNVRADVIRQFHGREDEDMVELLVLLEEEEWKRQAVIESLRKLDGEF